MVDVSNPENHTNITFIFYFLLKSNFVAFNKQ